MLDLGAHTGLAPVRFRVRISQRTALVGAFVGEVFGFRRNLLEPLTLSLAPIGAVVVEAGALRRAAGSTLRGCHEYSPQ